MIEFELLTMENYEIVLFIKHLLFPESRSDVDYEKYFNNNENCEYFLVTINKEPCGITGWYDFDDKNVDAFMGWFGVLPNFRKKGIGRKILEFTINRVKDRNFNYFRVYTDEAVNYPSVCLYEKESLIKERYSYPDKLGKTDSFVVFTKILKSNDNDLWNNRPLNEDFNYEL